MSEGFDPNQVITRGEPGESQGPRNTKERIYEKLRMPIWLLDTILVLLVVAVVVTLVVGAIKGSAL